MLGLTCKIPKLQEILHKLELYWYLAIEDNVFYNRHALLNKSIPDKFSARTKVNIVNNTPALEKH